MLVIRCALEISARTGHGLSQFAGLVSAALSRDFADIDVETEVSNGKLMAYLAAHGEVLSQRYSDEAVVIHCRIARAHLGRIASEVVTVRPHTNGIALPEVTADPVMHEEQEHSRAG